jgi:transposase InsO family protein
VLGQARSSQRYQLKDDADERPLIERMKALAATRQRYGQDPITVLLRKSGAGVNPKRVERLWRQEGLQVPRKPRKRRRLGTIDNSSERIRAQYKNHVGSYDFVADKTEDGRKLGFLSVVDEFTRESLALTPAAFAASCAGPRGPRASAPPQPSAPAADTGRTLTVPGT